MKKQNWSNAAIAITVLLCTIVLLAALTYAIAGFEPGGDKRKLSVDFKDITGIKLHTPVRYGGERIGAVTGIRYLTKEERVNSSDSSYIVRTTLHLDADTPGLTEDAQANLDSETLLSDKFIAIIPGQPNAEPFPDDGVIYAVSSDPLDRLNEMMGQLQEDYPKIINPITTALEKIDGVVIQVSTLLTNANLAIVEVGATIESIKSDYESELSPRVVSLIAEAEKAATQLSAVITNANQTIIASTEMVHHADHLVLGNTNAITNTLGDIGVIAKNLKVSTTYLKALSANLGEKPSRVFWGRKKINLPSEEDIINSQVPVIIDLPKD